MRQSGDSGWFAPAFGIVAVAVALRFAVLLFDRTDLFVDEAQYWLWAQVPDFGYYSKPPLIAWVIGAVTWLAGSDAQFWLRAPAPVLHGATALILAALAAHLAGRAAAVWTAAVYVTLPFVTLGSAMISTDTVMAPFWAGALLFFMRAADGGRGGDALAAGLCGGAAFLAKYAAVYLIPGAVLAACLVPALRPGWRNGALMAAGFAAMAAPNILWNLSHEMTTVAHTADNIGWLRHGAGVNIGSLAGFWGSQFAVFGPVTLAALILGLARWRYPGLSLFVLPPLLAVSAQALLDKAYANWAVGAYFAGTVLAVMVMDARWRRLAVAVNLVPALILPALMLAAPWPALNGQPLLARYLGRADLSRQIIALAQEAGAPVVAAERDVLADLFHTGRDAGVGFYAPPPQGRARHYYEQTRALPDALSGPVLMVTRQPPACEATPRPLEPRGYWAGAGIGAWLADAACARATFSDR